MPTPLLTWLPTRSLSLVISRLRLFSVLPVSDSPQLSLHGLRFSSGQWVSSASVSCRTFLLGTSEQLVVNLSLSFTTFVRYQLRSRSEACNLPQPASIFSSVAQR